MYCPRCRSEIKNNVLRCDFCGVKVNMICPACNSLTPFVQPNCAFCDFEVIKYCPECHSSNLYSADFCRKCGIELVESNTITEEISQPEVISEDENLLFNYEIDEDQDDTEQMTLDFENLSDEYVPIVIEKSQESMLSNTFVSEISETKEENSEKDYAKEAISAFEEVSEKIQEIKEQEYFEFKEEDFITSMAETKIEPIDEVIEENILLNNVETEEVIEDEGSLSSVEEIVETEKAEEIKKTEEIEEEIPIAPLPDIEINYYSQIHAKQKIVNTIKNSKDKFIVAINGDEGSGKSIVLQYVMKELQTENYISLFGECSPLTQINNFGFIQDALIRLLSLPTFITNPELFAKNNKKVFENIFSLLNSDEVIEFMNFLYPYKKGKFEEILSNKERTFVMLEKVVNSIISKNKVLVVVDDFDLVDGASYEFLMHLVEKNGYFDKGLKLLVAYKEKRVAQSYFYSNTLNESVFDTVYLENLPQEQIETFVGNFVNNNLDILPPTVRESIYRNSKGSAAFVEQVMSLLYDKKYLSIDNAQVRFNNYDDEISMIPSNVEEVVKERLKSLSPVLRNFLYCASIIGYKFDLQILVNAANLLDDQLDAILKELREKLFIVGINEYTYTFKGLSMWRYIFEEAKNDEFFHDNNRKIYNIINSCVLANNSMKAIIAQNLAEPRTLFDIWLENAELTANIGDINLYVISQKQRLKILADNSFENSQELYNEICEQIGKLIHTSNPVEAITYLSNVIANAKKAQDTVKIVDLCGYLVTSCYLTGNYHGVVEAVNLVLGLVEGSAFTAEAALIKSRKLKALYNIGNCEEVINLAKNDILPAIEEGLSKSSLAKNISMATAFEGWLETNFILANAYAIQGNDKGLEIIDNVLEVMKANNIENKYYETKAALSKALSYTVIGKVKESYALLTDITKAYKDEVLNDEFMSQWNLIHVLNQMLTDNFDNLKGQLFSLVTFANNTNDNFSKNILKTILGYIIQRDGDLNKALEIYNDQVTYFAKEKVAIGALLCWYLISQVNLTLDGADRALDIATKALEVSQNPKINNYNFIIYLQKFIAELYMIKGDLDSTKMYLEKSLLIAKQFGLKYAQVQLYIAFAKYLEEAITLKVVNKDETARNILKTYDFALSMALELDLENLIADVNKAKSAFKTYCQLNSINY